MNDEVRPTAFQLSDRIPGKYPAMQRLDRRRFLALTGGAAAMLALAACGDDADSDETPESSGASSAASTEGASPEETSATDDTADGGAAGGTLVVGLGADVATMDPHMSGSSFDRQLFHALYSPLVTIDTDLNIIPELVESWDVTDDTEYTFTLLPNITFHDGTALDAETVKWNFERMMQEDSQRRSELTLVESVEAVDEVTFTVHLSEPFAPFLSLLTDRAGMMVSRDAVEEFGEDFTTNPVGTGPFRFVEWVQRDHITVERFDDYFKEGLPYLDGVEYRIIADDTVKLTNLRTGDVHLIDTVPPKDIQATKSEPNLEVGEAMGLGYRDVILMTDQEPYDAVALRQALNWATDRDAIHSAIFFSAGMPAYGPIAPGHFAYDPDFQPYTYDVERATELLAEAGFEGGFTGTMKVINTPLELQIAQLLQAQWREAGIEVELEVLDFTTLLSDLRGKQFNALQISWSGRIDPDGNMYSQFICEGAFNDGNYCNPEVDEALETGRTNLDMDARTEAYREAQRLLVEEGAMVFIHHDAIVQAWRPEVQGYEVYADGMIRPVSVSIEE